MKNGYYLSAYVYIDKVTSVLDVEMRHDQNIALWQYTNKKLELVCYWELERLTGYKHHAKSFYNIEEFKQFLELLLGPFGLALSDIIQIWYKPSYKKYRECMWYRNISYHNLAHAFTGLLQDSNVFHNHKILTLSVDGGPDSLYLGKDSIHFSAIYEEYGSIIGVEKICSPAPLWSWAKFIFGLEEGSLMALMSASKSRVNNDDIFRAPIINDEETAYESYLFMKEICEYVFRMDEKEEGKKFNFYDKRFSVRENQISMVMKIVYRISCDLMCQNIEYMVEKYSILPEHTYLSVVGGYGLNCPSNSFLIEKYSFYDFIEVPCVNDGGISLGIGLLECYMKVPDLQFSLNTAYYGLKAGMVEEKELEKREDILDVSNISLEQFADDICKDVVVWIDGKCELGPRALGHRSLLAVPTEEMKDRLNTIKKRQWWRPVAPIVLEEYAMDWFEGCQISKFMLETFRVKQDKKQFVKAICHLDHSARVQTINDVDNLLLAQMIRGIMDKIRIPVVCNTSLNDRGEPIINSIERAIEFAIEKDISVVYINGVRIKVDTKIKLKKKEYNKFSQFFKHSYNKEQRCQVNPYELDRNELYYYFNSGMRNKLSLMNKRDVKIIKRLFHLRLGKFLNSRSI